MQALVLTLAMALTGQSHDMLGAAPDDPQVLLKAANAKLLSQQGEIKTLQDRLAALEDQKVDNAKRVVASEMQAEATRQAILSAEEEKKSLQARVAELEKEKKEAKPTVVEARISDTDMAKLVGLFAAQVKQITAPPAPKTTASPQPPPAKKIWKLADDSHKLWQSKDPDQLLAHVARENQRLKTQQSVLAPTQYFAAPPAQYYAVSDGGSPCAGGACVLPMSGGYSAPMFYGAAPVGNSCSSCR